MTGVSGAKDDNHAFEDITVDINLKSKGRDTHKTNFRLNLKWSNGAIFIFPWFFDLSELKGGLKARGSFFKKSLFISRFKLWGPFQINGKNLVLSLKNDNKKISKLFSSGELIFKADVKKLYELFIQEPFSDQSPFVSKLTPIGDLQCILNTRQIDLLVNFTLFFKKKRFLDEAKLQLSYPLSEEKACKKGRLDWKALFLDAFLPKRFSENSTVELLGNTLPLNVCNKSISAGPIRLRLGNAFLEFSKLDVNFEKRSLEIGKVKSDLINLKELIPDIPLNALIKIDFKRGYFNGDRFYLDGGIDLFVAKGEVKIRNLWIEPYAPIMRIGADIEFKDIDLYEITSKTSFGIVTGVVEGYVKNLIISGNQPEQFDLLIKTQESSKADKKISIKAIENLSILGGGEGSISFLGQLFKEFSYSKIGISCTLKNDVFELHGLIKDGNKEYLVKRGFWGGVNVINMNPKGRISFKDMLDRLKRITETETRKMEVR